MSSAVSGWQRARVRHRTWLKRARMVGAGVDGAGIDEAWIDEASMAGASIAGPGMPESGTAEAGPEIVVVPNVRPLLEHAPLAWAECKTF
jgi:hypothetical protein